MTVYFDSFGKKKRIKFLNQLELSVDTLLMLNFALDSGRGLWWDHCTCS